MNDVCIATITWARNEHEEKVLQASLAQLAILNVPVCVTDGGSSKKFLQYLYGISHFKVFEAKGLWPQVKKSIAEAAKTKSGFIFYTEPDKQNFFSNHVNLLLEAIDREKPGIVLASRSSKAFSTFPSFQQMTETAINNCCKEVIGKEFDYCYGPFLFHAQLLPFLNYLDNNCGWGWRPFLFAVASRLGFGIRKYEGDFYCPQHQKEDNDAEKIYRMKQLTQNINGLIQAATTDLSFK